MRLPAESPRQRLDGGGGVCRRACPPRLGGRGEACHLPAAAQSPRIDLAEGGSQSAWSAKQAEVGRGKRPSLFPIGSGFPPPLHNSLEWTDGEVPSRCRRIARRRGSSTGHGWFRTSDISRVKTARRPSVTEFARLSREFGQLERGGLRRSAQQCVHSFSWGVPVERFSWAAVELGG